MIRMGMHDSHYHNELSIQRRNMQVMLIKQLHPIYETFRFEACTDSKIAEMYSLLVEGTEGMKDTEVQTNV
jgi:hypothetical protein